MKENFLRPPRGVAEYAADAVRVLGVLSVVVAAIWWQPTDAGVVAFALPALVLPRFVGMRAGADLACQIIVLIAAWSNVFDLYRTVAGWDLAVHFAGTGALVVVTYLLLARARIVLAPDDPAFTMRGAIVLSTVIGLALSAVWEMVEWAGWRFISSEIHVSYEDTIGDMSAGALGAVIAGILLGRVRLLRRDAA